MQVGLTDDEREEFKKTVEKLKQGNKTEPIEEVVKGAGRSIHVDDATYAILKRCAKRDSRTIPITTRFAAAAYEKILDLQDKEGGDIVERLVRDAASKASK